MQKTDKKYYIMVEGERYVYDIRVFNNKEATKRQYQQILASKETAFGVYQECELTISYGDLMLLPIKHKNIKKEFSK